MRTRTPSISLLLQNEPIVRHRIVAEEDQGRRTLISAFNERQGILFFDRQPLHPLDISVKGKTLFRSSHPEDTSLGRKRLFEKNSQTAMGRTSVFPQSFERSNAELFGISKVQRPTRELIQTQSPLLQGRQYPGVIEGDSSIRALQESVGGSSLGEVAVHSLSETVSIELLEGVARDEIQSEETAQLREINQAYIKDREEQEERYKVRQKRENELFEAFQDAQECVQKETRRRNLIVSSEQVNTTIRQTSVTHINNVVLDDGTPTSESDVLRPMNTKAPHQESSSTKLRSESLSSFDIMDDDPFEFIEPLIPTEHLVPHIRDAPPRAMGPPLTAAEWSACFTGDERRVDPQRLAKARAVAFAGGIDDSIRLEVWHFLLRVYPEDATEAQREEVRDRYRSMYEKLTAQWTSIFPEQEQRFTAFREVRAAIMKDVVRTDRAHPSYAGDESEKQQMLRDVLMAYAMFNFDLGYCQGMSDILSIIALLSKSNVEAFTCFSCFLSERCENNFRQDVRVGMGEQLNALQTLIRHFVPCLYVHLVKQHADDMSFCFRWLLMLFKREFPIKDTMLLWDVLLSCPYTPQFEIFLAAALLKALTPQILQQHLTYDELLKFANGVAGVLDVRHVIVLAQDFYDEVASRTFELGTSRALQSGNYRPTLSDIMRVLSNA